MKWGHMRGVMFRAYMSFIKNSFDNKTLDKLLQSEDYPNKGGFSALGNYKTKYLSSLMSNSSYLFNGSINKTMQLFGKYTYKYLVNRVIKLYGAKNNIIKHDNPYDFLENLNSFHIDEIQKLYPDAKFPEFMINRIDKKHIILEYSSFRDLPYLTYGLIEGCLEYYNDKSTVKMTQTNRVKTIENKECPVYTFEVYANE